jgi:nitrate reductase (NAD(P)H)
MPPHVDAELAKSENWWYKPEYICNDLSLNSAIAKPDHDEVLKVIPNGKYTCGGYCYTGGGRRITRIEVSLNGGALWNLAQINITEKPSRSGKYWCWIFWEYTCTHEELAGATEIVLRGWDEGHNTQVHRSSLIIHLAALRATFKLNLIRSISVTSYKPLLCCHRNYHTA